MSPVALAPGAAIDVNDRPTRLLGAVTTDALKTTDLHRQPITNNLIVDISEMPPIIGTVTTDALKPADLNIDGTKDLQVDVKTLPPVTGAVTTDALKASDLSIDSSEKLLGVALADAVTRILLNSSMTRMMLDAAGRVLVKIDVAGTATPISGSVTVSGSVTATVASTTITAITPFPYTGYDHEKMMTEQAFQGIRGRMTFT